MTDSQFTYSRMVACTRRIAPDSCGTKATSLGTARVEHAAWCMPSPHARDLGIDHLLGEQLAVRDSRELQPRGVPRLLHVRVGLLAARPPLRLVADAVHLDAL